MNFTEKYFINEEKKVVVCKIEDCSCSLVCDMCHMNWPSHEDLFIADEFIGKAKCSPEDTFDIEIGKQIAYKRAVAKLFKAKERTLIAFIEEHKKMFDQLKKDSNKLIRKYEGMISNSENINKIIK